MLTKTKGRKDAPVANALFTIVAAWVLTGLLPVHASEGAPTAKTSAPPSGDLYELVKTFENPDGSRNSFGVGLTMTEDYIFVGARHEARGATLSGAVYQYAYPSLELVRSYGNPSVKAGDAFGSRISANDDYLAVCSRYDDTAASGGGAVYLYDVETGNLVDSLFSPNPTVDGAFGTALEFVGETLVVGAFGDAENAIASGVIYQFDLATRSLIQTIRDPDPQAGDTFGWQIDHLGNNLLVGCRANDEDGTDNGIAYLFDLQSGSLLHTLHNPHPSQTNSQFGSSVHLSEEFAYVGSPSDDAFGSEAGSVSVFDLQTGNVVDVLSEPESAGSGGRFGAKVVVSDNLLIVGSQPSTRSGTVSVFDQETLNFYQKIESPNGTNNDYFGLTISAFLDRMVVGAGNRDTAYLYESDLPSGMVQRIPSGGGEAVEYGSLSGALAEAASGDRILIEGFEIVEDPISVSTPGISIEATGQGPAGLAEGFNLEAGEPLLIIEPSADNVTISGLSFVGNGVAPNSDDSLTVGASGISNFSTDLLIENCEFTNLGSGSFLGGGAVVNGDGSESGFATLVVEESEFDRNSTALRVSGGSVQVVDCSFQNGGVADVLSWDADYSGDPGYATATVQIMDSTFTTPDPTLEPPDYRLYSAGSPSALEIVGSVIGSAKKSNLFFGDGHLNLSYSAVFNSFETNRDVLTLGSVYEGETAGIPTVATIDHCDLYNHGVPISPSIFEDGLGAIIHAGEIPNASGMRNAPCTVFVFDSILAATGAGDGSKVAVVLSTIDEATPELPASEIQIDRTVIARNGSHSLDTSIVGEPVSIGQVSFMNPHYRVPGPVLGESDFEFRYARNSVAATFGASGAPIGSAGPSDWLGITLSVPSGMEYDLRDGDIEVPVLVDDASGVAGVDVTIHFDPTSFTALDPSVGPEFSGAVFASEIREGEIQVSMLPDGSNEATGEQVLFSLNLTPLAMVEDSAIDIVRQEISTADFEFFETDAVSGDVSVTTEFIPGDADLSGRVDILDVVAVLRHIVGSEELPPAGLEMAELATPAGIDIRDAIALFAIVIGEEESE